MGTLLMHWTVGGKTKKKKKQFVEQTTSNSPCCPLCRAFTQSLTDSQHKSLKVPRQLTLNAVFNRQLRNLLVGVKN